MPLPNMCHVVIVDRSDLPTGHKFVIVRQADDQVVVYAASDDAAQLEARAAFLVWDRLRRTPAPTG